MVSPETSKRPAAFSLLSCLPVRGVGCIFYEMAAGRPLFPGSTVEDELHLIFRLLGECCPLLAEKHTGLLYAHLALVAQLDFNRRKRSSAGTPTEDTWPGISSIDEFKSYKFPKYKAQPLINHAPR